MEIQIAVIAALILGFTQFITWMFPKLNKMNTTLVVTAVIGILAITVEESVGILTIFLAIAVEVFGYNLITKSVIPTVKNFRK